MKIRRIGLALILSGMVGVAWPVGAQLALTQSYDAVFEGDDPGKVLHVDLPYDPVTPVLLGVGIIGAIAGRRFRTA